MKKKIRALLARSSGRDSPLPESKILSPPSSTEQSTSLPPTVISDGDSLVLATLRGRLLETASATLLSKISDDEKAAFKEASRSMDERALLSDVRAYDLAHKNDSSFRPQEERLSKLLNSFSRFMRLFAMDASPEISVIVGSFRIVIDLALRFTIFFSKLSDMICKFQDYLEPLLVYAQVKNKLVEEAIVNVYVTMLQFGWKARRVFVTSNGVQRKWTSLRAFIRQQWDDFESEFESIELDMKHHLGILMHSVQAHQYSDLSNDRMDRQRKEERKEKLAFLSWVSDIDFEDVHQKIYAERSEQTCDWLLREPKFQQWFNSSTSTLLWCYGKPGIGKSVLASYVLEHITAERGLQQNTAICFAYYDYKKPHLGNISQIISALIRQICRKRASIPTYLLNLMNEGLTSSSIATQEKLASLLEEYTQAFLVFDALDECQEEERESLLRFITEIITLQLPCIVKIFATSRKEMDIAKAFEVERVPTVSIRAESVATDIQTFARGQVEKLRAGKHGKTLYVKSDELAEDIIKTLTTKADGMFLWVKLQLDSLCQYSKAHNDQQVEDALSKLPKNLESTYFRILEQIDVQVSNLRELALKCLTWIVYAYRPLSIYELQLALAINPTCKSEDDLKQTSLKVILEACCNLLEESDGFIRPVHYTAQEFLLKRPIQGLSQNSVRAQLLDSDNMHKHLSLACLWYINMVAFEEVVKLDIDLIERLGKNCFAYYAYMYFDFHISLCGDICHDITQQLGKFLQLDSQYLAAALQIRILLATSRRYMHSGYFQILNQSTPIDFPVSASSIIYSTRLYNIPLLRDQWTDHTPPKNALHLACYAELVDAVSALIESGCDVDEKDSTGATPLTCATSGTSLQVVELLLQAKAQYSNFNDGLVSALHTASVSGREQIVNLILKYKVDIDAQREGLGSALTRASRAGHESVVKLLLYRGANVDTQGGFHGNALRAASIRGSESIVKLLLSHGANVNVQGRDSNALVAASKEGFESVVKLLLNHGADINTQDESYGTALDAASSFGRELTVKLLLSQGADINAQGRFYGTALGAASSSGHESIVKLLLSQGADINAQGGKYGTALEAASSSGHESTVKLLLSQGADINAQGGKYGTALQAASSSGCESVVKLLLNYGADVNAQGGEYGNALQAASSSGCESVVKLLLNYGADVNAQGGEYGNALQAAAERGSKSVVKLLLDWGANINAQGGEFGSALQAASYYGSKSVVELLLNRGADVNTQVKGYDTSLEVISALYHNTDNEDEVETLLSQGDDGKAQGGWYSTALQAASHRGKLAVVIELLSQGADINAQGGKFGTALQAASHRGKLLVVNELLSQGADINAQGGTFGTALQAASHRGKLLVVNKLLSQGADINAQGGIFGTALQAASALCPEKDSKALVNKLISQGADINAQGGEFGTALQAASYRGNLAVVNELLSQGADVNARGGEYGNSLQAASIMDLNVNVKHYEKYRATVKLLLDWGADVNAMGGVYENALTAASVGGNKSTVQLLLSWGADVKVQGRFYIYYNNRRDGWYYGSALQVAAYKGHKSIVELLLSKGADINESGDYFPNAVQAASREDKEEDADSSDEEDEASYRNQEEVKYFLLEYIAKNRLESSGYDLCDFEFFHVETCE